MAHKAAAAQPEDNIIAFGTSSPLPSHPSPPPPSKPATMSSSSLGAGRGAFSNFFREMEYEDDLESGGVVPCADGGGLGAPPGSADMHSLVMLSRRVEDFDLLPDEDAVVAHPHDGRFTLCYAIHDDDGVEVQQVLNPIAGSGGGGVLARSMTDRLSNYYDDDYLSLDSDRHMLSQFQRMRMLPPTTTGSVSPPPLLLGNSISSKLPLHHPHHALEDESSLLLPLEVSLQQQMKPAKVLHGRYAIGSRIGRGSYGKVKDCIDMWTLRRYAIKIMSRHVVKRIPHGFRNIEREIQLMRQLPAHRNVIQWIADFYEDDGAKTCVVMEYCLGSIHDLQASGLNDSIVFRRLPNYQAHNYFVQVMAGVEFLHSQRIIHQDLKPGNLLLDAQECVKITDFGVSEQLSAYSGSDCIRVCQTTPAIQPPEVASGIAKVFSGYKVDYYCCGICLYFMLTGRVPFNTGNVLAIFDVICEGRYEMPDYIVPGAAHLIRQLLCKDPLERYGLEEVHQDAWFCGRHAVDAAPVPLQYLFQSYGQVILGTGGADWDGPPQYAEMPVSQSWCVSQLHAEEEEYGEEPGDYEGENGYAMMMLQQQQQDDEEEQPMGEALNASLLSSQQCDASSVIGQSSNPLTLLSRLRITHGLAPLSDHPYNQQQQQSHYYPHSTTTTTHNAAHHPLPEAPCIVHSLSNHIHELNPTTTTNPPSLSLSVTNAGQAGSVTAASPIGSTPTSSCSPSISQPQTNVIGSSQKSNSKSRSKKWKQCDLM